MTNVVAHDCHDSLLMIAMLAGGSELPSQKIGRPVRSRREIDKMRGKPPVSEAASARGK